MKKRMIDRDEAISLMEKAVIERGEDWRYPRETMGMKCVYFMPSHVEDELVERTGLQKGGPACLVGMALSFVGLTEEIVGYSNDESVLCVSNCAAESDEVDWVLSGGAITVFNAAQKVQDRGGEWGAALKVAKEIS